MAALFVCTFGISNPFAAYGVFLPVLSDTFGWSRGALSAAMSVNLVIGGFVGFFVGAVADRHGPRLALLTTTAFAGVGFTLMATVSALWHVYVLVGVLAGIGMSGFYVINTATVARWFVDRRGFALGLVLTGFNAGYMTGGPAAAILIQRVGWRAAWATLSIVMCGFSALAALTVTYPPSSPAAPRHAHASAAGDIGFRRAMREPRLWLLSASWLLQGFVVIMLSVHVVPYARDVGISLERAALALTAYGIGATSGRLTVGAVADRLGGGFAMRACATVQLLSLTPILIGPSEGWLVASFLAFGFGFAGADTVFARAVPETFGVRSLGAIMGMLSLAWRCGAALGPTAAGFLRDATGAYTLPFGAAPIALLVSYLLYGLGARRVR